jgi:hypothetical protein
MVQLGFTIPESTHLSFKLCWVMLFWHKNSQLECWKKAFIGRLLLSVVPQGKARFALKYRSAHSRELDQSIAAFAETEKNHGIN